MKCPMCGSEMETKRSDSSHNSKDGKKYTRTVYVCKKDDAWVTTEIPVSGDGADHRN